MTRRRRAFLAAGAVVAALLLAAATLEFDAPRLGQALLDHAGAASGARLSAGRFRLKLSRGVVLHGVRAETDLGAGATSAEIDELVFAPRWLPLLRGHLEVTRVRVLRPRVRVSETKGAAARARRPSAPAVPPPLSVHLRELSVEDGQFVLPGLALEGVSLRLQDVTLDAPGLAGLSGRGDLRVDRIPHAATTVEGLTTAFTLARGRLATESLAFTTPEGRFTGTFEAQLDREEVAYTLALDGRPLDLNTLAAGAGGGRLGPARLQLEGRGEGTEPAGLTGAGLVALEGGTLPALPLLAALERALGRTRLVGAAYEPAEIRYRLAAGRLVLEPFALRSGAFALRVSGASALDGRVDLDVVVEAPRDGLQLPGVSGAVLDALTGEDGRIAVPLRVTGVRPDLVVRPDTAALAAQAGRGAGEKVRDAARAFGQRWLERRR